METGYKLQFHKVSLLILDVQYENEGTDFSLSVNENIL